MKIEFISNKKNLTEDSISVPSPVIKSVPEWYRVADKYHKDHNGNYPNGPDGGKILTWKSCPALLDIFGTGYVFKTPCDIDFFINEEGIIDIKIENPEFQNFCTKRPPMNQFYQPDGYHLEHFAWTPDWAVKLPEGYSAIYTTPLNRFDLPFIMTSGIIDNDKVNLPGSMPFFLLEGFTGTIPAGTPYCQIIPFKRENWESEIIIQDEKSIVENNIANARKYRIPNGGFYKNNVWEKRKYE